MKKNTMSEEARKLRNAYHREWNAKNRERIREYSRRCWEKKAKEAMKPGVKAKD